jgi:hypothetical protein
MRKLKARNLKELEKAGQNLDKPDKKMGKRMCGCDSMC